jgi:hypothetical protein
MSDLGEVLNMLKNKLKGTEIADGIIALKTNIDGLVSIATSLSQ